MTTAQRPMLVTVTATRPLTERMVRITLTAEGLDTFDYAGPYHLARLFLPTGPATRRYR